MKDKSLIANIWVKLQNDAEQLKFFKKGNLKRRSILCTDFSAHLVEMGPVRTTGEA